MRFTHSKMVKGALTAVVVLGAGQVHFAHNANAASKAVEAPVFEVDPFWPKRLPNHWILGPVNGIAIDARDHVFITHRVDKFMPQEIGLKGGVSECCAPAPQVLEFDPQGNLVNSWGGPGDGYKWPAVNYGIAVDSKGNVWITGAGGAPAAGRAPAEPIDSHILKFTKEGKFVQQLGEPLKNPDSNATTHFGRPADIAIDEKRGEVYVADGFGHKRIAVLDFASGRIKKVWGAYGEKPSDAAITFNPGDPPPKQFVGPVHCVTPSNDGLLYVCDGGANRIQVFKRDGSFVIEKQIAPQTKGQGSVWDIALSRDKDQKYMYVADGQNMKVYVMDRKSMEVLYTFGDGGRLPGLWYTPRAIATDSKGNVYTVEEGRRVQKFNFLGVKPVTQQAVGAQWPKPKT